MTRGRPQAHDNYFVLFKQNSTNHGRTAERHLVTITPPGAVWPGRAGRFGKVLSLGDIRAQLSAFLEQPDWRLHSGAVRRRLTVSQESTREVPAKDTIKGREVIAVIRDLSRNLRARSILSHGQKINPVSGDQVTYVNTHKVHVSADELMLEDDGGTPRRAAPVDVTIDVNASGANGLDTGSKSPSTWYHIWIISQFSGVAQGLLSASASNPTLPGGYTFKAYVGAIYNTSDHLISYLQNDRLVWADKTTPLGVAAFPTTPTSIDLSASVPSTAVSAIIELSGLTTIGGHYISNVSIGPTSNGPWHNRWMMVAGTSQGAGGIDHVQFVTLNEIFLDSAQEIYAYVDSANDYLGISVLGWRY
ncbi:hypothetical protein SBA2_50022 [Acidobacteriia bacterium SbA2]|nr:hypothetical protein SBA2_50022 [Acidobacteriia bacterium SbA2]